MIFALYVVLGWLLVGGVAALLMGRAIAICSNDRSDAAPCGTQEMAGTGDKKDWAAAKAA